MHEVTSIVHKKDESFRARRTRWSILLVPLVPVWVPVAAADVAAVHEWVWVGEVEGDETVVDVGEVEWRRDDWT